MTVTEGTIVVIVSTFFILDSAIGPFAITPVYWKSSGKPTIGGISSEAPDAFESCTKTLFCSALTVQGYMRKFKEDCNNDGDIDCDDFVLIHHYGAYGCKGTSLEGNIRKRYEQCKQYIDQETDP
ncbi:invertebrate-type lysozyme 6-like isoform X2 [Diorhabda sublineata]|uniref:invertebrate-type lysozyme 6-like isoform X2 n=1 Tax=Diorhabda sublineata TaxID=1163346 RepID=UPI0024E0DBFF|nr:invertebrate-type lysozyme 6-like isoform X2 [Diorhabda sublineata]